MSLQCAPGGGQDVVLIENAAHVPASFVREELGFGMGEGPSAEYTAANLDATNERNRAVLAENERPKVLEQERKRREKAMTARQINRRFRKAMQKLGGRRTAA